MQPLPQKWQYKTTADGTTVVNSEMVVHRFCTAVVLGPLIAGQLLDSWTTSEAAQWVHDHAIGKIRLANYHNVHTDITDYKIIARLTETDQTYYRLKYQ